MRLTLCWFGMELDLYLGETRVDEEPELVFEAGSYTSQPVGFCPSIEPDWEKPLNRLDPGDDEDRR